MQAKKNIRDYMLNIVCKLGLQFTPCGNHRKTADLFYIRHWDLGIKARDLTVLRTTYK